MSDNKDTYNSSAVLQWYNDQTGLTEAEKLLFGKHREALHKATLLDIGIGGGRTTAALYKTCGRYTGIDYAEGFIRIATGKFPGADLRVLDARDLSAFAEGSFDIVNFSFNGIDYVDSGGRTRILKEISRVLKPGGLFLFSTHNRSHSSFNRSPWNDRSLSLFTRLKTFVRLLPYLPRHIRQQKKELHTSDYAIINDSAHNYGLMTFYTDPQFLLKQLENEGFQKILLHNRKGEEKTTTELDDWIFITCVKTGDGSPGETH